MGSVVKYVDQVKKKMGYVVKLKKKEEKSEVNTGENDWPVIIEY